MSTVTMSVTQSEPEKMLFQGCWRIENTVEFQKLNIRERALVTAPEGKKLTMIVNGIVKDIRPGIYLGRVVLAVTDCYAVRPAGLMQFNGVSCALSPAICVENGRLSPEKSVTEAVWGGSFDDEGADGVYLGADAEDFNGILLDNSDYLIQNSRFDFEGFGCNDFAGADCGVTALGKSDVTVRDCRFNFSGVTRCAIHTGGESRMLVERCDILNMSPASDWLGRFSWQISLRGTNRLCQLTDNGQVTYQNCRLKSNGWGGISIDGSDEFVRLTLRDSTLELVGPRSHGYGVFNIGPNEVNVDHSVIDVNGSPILMMGMEGKARTNVRGGSLIRGRQFGAMITGDDNSVLDIRDSAFATGKACFFLKGSATVINAENCTLTPGNGILLQLVDTDESGMDVVRYHVPAGVADTPVAGRCVTSVSARDDVVVNFSHMSAAGDILNSTTNIRAYRNSERGGMGTFHDTLVGPVSFSGPTGEGDPEMESGRAGHDPEELRGPKNLGVNLRSASVEGIISAAVQRYREGVAEITPDNWFDLTDIRQTPAPAVNNGVVVCLDSDSVWTVTGTCWLTGLTLAVGASVRGADGKAVSMAVNGKNTELLPGVYAGEIVLSLA